MNSSLSVPVVLCRVEDGKLRDIVRFKGPTLTIGRALDCDYVIDNRCVSRQHAQLLCRDGECYVFDLASACGTLVNGRSIGRYPLRLRVNDRLTIHETEFVLKLATQIRPAESDDLDRRRIAEYKRKSGRERVWVPRSLRHWLRSLAKANPQTDHSSEPTRIGAAAQNSRTV